MITWRMVLTAITVQLRLLVLPLYSKRSDLQDFDIFFLYEISKERFFSGELNRIASEKRCQRFQELKDRIQPFHFCSLIRPRTNEAYWRVGYEHFRPYRAKVTIIEWMQTHCGATCSTCGLPILHTRMVVLIYLGTD